MSTHCKVQNLSTDWRDNHVIKVTTQEKDAAGNWKDSTFEILKAQDVSDDLWAYNDRRYIVEEWDHGRSQ